MGVNVSTVAEDTVDLLQYELVKHVNTLTELNDLSYDDFQKVLLELNELSKKCFSASESLLVFAVKKSTDETVIWKATVKIACVKVEKATKRIESYKLLSLKQFMRVFKTFQAHLQAMDDSQTQTRSRISTFSPSLLLDEMESLAQQISPEKTPHLNSPSAYNNDVLNECCICLDRKPDILLPCTHAYCCPCIEQWKMTSQTCPICQAKIDTLEEGWVLTELPEMQEVNDKIYTELQDLSKE